MECQEILAIFLGGTFHQDIESEESALKEYCELGNEALNEVIDTIDEFLILPSSKEEKNKFIEKNAEIYFPALEKEPMDWLEDIKKKLISVIDKNRNK